MCESMFRSNMNTLAEPLSPDQGVFTAAHVPHPPASSGGHGRDLIPVFGSEKVSHVFFTACCFSDETDWNKVYMEKCPRCEEIRLTIKRSAHLCPQPEIALEKEIIQIPLLGLVSG